MKHAFQAKSSGTTPRLASGCAALQTSNRNKSDAAWFNGDRIT